MNSEVRVPFSLNQCGNIPGLKGYIRVVYDNTSTEEFFKQMLYAFKDAKIDDFYLESIEQTFKNICDSIVLREGLNCSDRDVGFHSIYGVFKLIDEGLKNSGCGELMHLVDLTINIITKNGNMHPYGFSLGRFSADDESRIKVKMYFVTDYYFCCMPLSCPVAAPTPVVASQPSPVAAPTPVVASQYYPVASQYYPVAAPTPVVASQPSPVASQYYPVASQHYPVAAPTPVIDNQLRECGYYSGNLLAIEEYGGIGNDSIIAEKDVSSKGNNCLFYSLAASLSNLKVNDYKPVIKMLNDEPNFLRKMCGIELGEKVDYQKITEIINRAFEQSGVVAADIHILFFNVATHYEHYMDNYFVLYSNNKKSVENGIVLPVLLRSCHFQIIEVKRKMQLKELIYRICEAYFNCGNNLGSTANKIYEEITKKI